MTKTQFKNMAKYKFLRFQNQKKAYLQRFSFRGFMDSMTDEDRVLGELLRQIDDDILYQDKIIMGRFKRRFNNWVLYSSIQFFKR